MDDVILRPATHDDIPAIVHVHNASWRSTYAGLMAAETLDAVVTVERRTAQWTRTLDRPEDNIVIVAEQGGQIVGFVNGGAEREGVPDYDGELYALYLLASAQGQGIGKALFYRLAADLQSSGFVSLVLWVLKDNLPARRFYEQLGGVHVTERGFTIVQDNVLEIAYGWPKIPAF